MSSGQLRLGRAHVELRRGARRRVRPPGAPGAGPAGPGHPRAAAVRRARGRGGRGQHRREVGGVPHRRPVGAARPSTTSSRPRRRPARRRVSTRPTYSGPSRCGSMIREPAASARSSRLRARSTSPRRQPQLSVHHVGAEGVDALRLQLVGIVDEPARLVEPAEHDQHLGCVAAAPHPLAALEPERLGHAHALQCQLCGLLQATVVVEQGLQVDHGAADVVDVVELLLRDPAGLEQLGDALLDPAGVREGHAEVAPSVALDRASVRHERGHRDRLARQRLGLLEPVGQHQHLRQPAQHGGPPRVGGSAGTSSTARWYDASACRVSADIHR